MRSHYKSGVSFSIRLIVRNWLRKIRIHFRKTLRTSTSATSIAWGFSIGSFIAIMPTPGISVLIGLGLVLIFPKLNKIALFLAMLIWNPFTIYPLYFLSFQLGDWLVGTQSSLDAALSLTDQIQGYTVQFMTGNIIVASFFAAVCYVVIYQLVLKYRKFKSSNDSSKQG